MLDTLIFIFASVQLRIDRHLWLATFEIAHQNQATADAPLLYQIPTSDRTETILSPQNDFLSPQPRFGRHSRRLA
jgi:hypothetical protein